MIDVLVADDEQPARDELAHLLRQDPRIGQILVAGSGADALRELTAHMVAIAFLDIHMPGLSGMDLARSLRTLAEPPAVVFVTADDARAVDAFDLRAADYLLKPVRTDRLRRAIDRAVEIGGGAAPVDDEVLTVTVGSSVRFVHRSDVRWVQAQGDYSRLHMADGTGHLVRIPISELEQRWADAGFVRLHRSYLAATGAIDEARLSGGEPSVSVGAVALPVSRRLLPVVREALVRRDGAAGGRAAGGSIR